jgi:prevent-host-death family protein
MNEIPTLRNIWSVSEAKANLAAFLKAAEKKPQMITVRGVAKAEIRLLPGAVTPAEKMKRARKK